jgi:hypothetical protein
VIQHLENKGKELSHGSETVTRQWNTAFKILTDRMGRNAYIDKRRNILSVWSDFVKQERNAVNSVVAIARKYFQLEVFARIRRQAKENELESRAEKILYNFFRMTKQGTLFRAFSKWRGKAFDLKKNDLI